MPKTSYPCNYRDHRIERLFPSGYFEFYCRKQERFLKFDDIGECKAAIRESIQSAVTAAKPK